MPTAPLTATGHADINRRFLNPFELQTPIESRAGAFIAQGRVSIRFLEELLHSELRRLLTNDHKIPGLHEPNRAGMMRSGQNPRKHSTRNWRLQKILSNVPSLENYTVDGFTFRFGKPAIVGKEIVGLQTHTTLLE
jgi:hypothetical protein